METMGKDADDVARNVADSWDQEAEKISAEDRANDPEARKMFMMLKVLARMAREGKIQQSFTRAIDKISTATPEELIGQFENLQKDYDLDLVGEMEKIIKFVTAGIKAQTPSETAADDLIRSMFAGK
jgi:hypothetical protein